MESEQQPYTGRQEFVSQIRKLSLAYFKWWLYKVILIKSIDSWQMLVSLIV